MLGMEKYIVTIIILSFLGCSCTSTREEKSDISEKIYQEHYRPQFHFTPEANWMNDPNGMVYYEGEYHLFYQYHPESSVWGPMHWGHAISKDMVHWEHLPIALYPDSLGYIFSGSAVIDRENTSGFGSEDKPAMVAIYTYHNMEGEKAGRNDYQSQGVAYSTDKGRTWTKYANNPVLKSPGIRDFRDPKVSWNKASQKWIMALAVQDYISFYSSPNLIDWTFESDFGKEFGAHGGVWECPDLIPFTVDETDEQKWVLLVSINPGGPNGGSATQYFVGDFDGKKFTCETAETKWIDYGKDNYAGVTWAGIPEEDGRKLFIGWMSNWQYATIVPTYKWRSAMTFPRELILKRIKNDYQLYSLPVKELELIREECYIVPNQDIKGNFDVTNAIPFKAIPLEIDLEIEWDEQPQKFGVKLSNSAGEELEAFYSGVNESFTIDRTKLKDVSFSDVFASIDKANISCKKGIKLQILIDESSIEVFVNDGELVMTDQFFSTEKFDKIEIVSGGNISVKEAKFYKLKSVW
ncbi:MAG: glycosyl hydrolase family 32 [Bacteroidales bacterium]|nr:MAG: glycosyl hydrolase family 32 [Bacteroidales bacterium]